MGVTFTITQSPGNTNLFLYPNGNYHNDCTAVGAASNYLCVDENYDVPDDDTTYVWASNVSTVTDMFTLENHTTETGTINYVKIFTRAKSHLYTQSGSGVYRILANHSAVTSRGIDNNLTTDYNYFSYMLTSTPSGAAWNWTAVDNLKIGFDCSSPTMYGASLNWTIRPNAGGDYTQNNYYDGSSHAPDVNMNYTTVDETTLDTGDYVYTIMNDWDTYELQNHTTETGSINSVTVYANSAYTVTGGYIRLVLSIGGVLFQSSDTPVTSGWKYYSNTWASNPSTGVGWTWADIDSLQAGIYNYTAKTSQVYVVVNYDEDITPRLHTTQCYAVVNYTISTTTCFLNQPTRYGISNTRKVGIVQPERGDRVVYDICRDSKILTMEGFEFDTTTSTATTRLLCVRNMKDNGTYITIEDIDTKVDTTWLITDFNYDRDENNPALWKWFLTAEKYEDG